MNVAPYYLADASGNRLVLPDGETRILLYYKDSLMRVFTTTELDRLQETQESAMQDTCIIQAYSSTPDAYGNPTPTYTDGEPIVGGLDLMGPKEIQGSGDVPIIEALLRLPLYAIYGYVTPVNERDRIKVTHRFGVALSIAQVFEVAGPVERGPSGLMLSLKVVDDE